eukprot:jgi/Orpsp1_1/1175545/evm.model.c7180000054268.1
MKMIQMLVNFTLVLPLLFQVTLVELSQENSTNLQFQECVVILIVMNFSLKLM